MYTYSAFGLSIGSDLEIPEFLPFNTNPEVFFHIGNVESPVVRTDDPVRIIQQKESGILLYWSRTGTFLVENGQYVTISPEPGISENLVRLLLTGPVLGVLLHQRGYNVFHASLVSTPVSNVAIGFLARKGYGKSTMATAMYNHGYRLMSDDIIAVSETDGNISVKPGFPYLKLWNEAAEVLVENGDQVKTIDPRFNKQGCTIKKRFSARPARLKMLFVLEFGSELSIQPILGKEALLYVLPHWYGALFDGQMLDIFGKDKHFTQCTQLIKSVPLYRLTRPQSFDRLPEVVYTVDRFILENSEKN